MQGVKRMALVLACWSTSGCLAADEPTFQEPVKTPPFLLAQTAVPDVTQPRQDFGNPVVDKVELSVEVRSEDAGDPLVAKLVYNYPKDPIDLGPSGRFPPGKLGDTERILSLTLERSRLPLDVSKSPPELWTGCLQVSMLVTHKSSTDIQNGVAFLDLENDIGVITWWFNIPDPDGATSTLDGCAKRLGTAQ